jgi:transcriptional regulator with XRE-family HTH domain
MKPSEKKLGLELQLFLMRNSMQIDDLARQMGITADALSNLIHGRRGFKNETLKKLADTSAIREGGLSLIQLRALRSMDEYSFEELLLAIMEYIKQGEIERLPKDFFHRLQAAMERSSISPTMAEKQNALLALFQAIPTEEAV